MRLPLTGLALAVQRLGEAAHDVVGHVVVDVVGQLDEAERLAERPAAPATTGSSGRWAGSGRRRRGRG